MCDLESTEFNRNASHVWSCYHGYGGWHFLWLCAMLSSPDSEDVRTEETKHIPQIP
uniref:Uncharacterized protein n=1 Tax=Anguilla anguilla TaxID=7936 RepID=A0A0E9XU58_ANGAN